MASIIGSNMLKVASLFSGCGGMDLGILGGFTYLGKRYKNLPFKIVYAVDNDPYAISIYNENFHHKAEIKDVQEIAPNQVPDHDILLGGFPCQSFSIVAQNPPRLGFKDEKGKLFFEMVKILKQKKPRFFIAENVKGLLSVNNKKTFPMIINEFEKSGYHITYKLFNSAEYNIPQKRERIFIIGFRDLGDYNSFQFPEGPTKKKPVPLHLALDKDADYNEKWFFSQRAIEGMLRVRKKMNKGRVQNINSPSNTISSHLAKVSLNGTDPVLMVNGRYRRFSPREAANIQSFPKNFKFEIVSENRQYRAIGNAVPPVLMWHIAKELTKLFR